MKTRFRLIRRGLRGGAFYCVDTTTGRRTSLHTGSEDEARQFVEARNQAQRQPEINLQIAKAYLAAADENFVKRTWREVMAEFVKVKTGSNRTRSERAIMDKAFDSIRDLQLPETRPEHFLRMLHLGKVSTNNYLRRLHNFAVDMGWLPWPVMPKRRWPAIHYRDRRAITRSEHELILSREQNPEIRAFLWCCWHIGGSQSDVAHLKAEDIDWQDRVVSFFRAKTGTAQIIHFGDALAEVLRDLPGGGVLFPRLAAMDEKHRAARFQRACRRVGVCGVSLHSYRYAWAERAKVAGYPERFAQLALGHNSKAVHRAYAKKAQVTLPGDTTTLFLLGRWDADSGKGLGVAGQETVQPADQFGGIGFIGVDTFAQRVEFHGADEVAVDAPGLELASQAEAAGAGSRDREDLFGLGELFFDKAFHMQTRIDALGWLGAGAIELADNTQVSGVLVNAQEDALVERVCRLRIGGDCVEVLGVSVGLHIHDEVNCLFTNLRCRPSRLLPTLMPSLDR